MFRKKKNEILSELLGGRRRLVEVILSAVVLGLGVNVVATSLPELLELPTEWTLIAGSIMTLGTLLYLLARLVNERIRVCAYQATICYDEPQKRIVNVPRYHYSEELVRNLNALFSEDTNSKAQWEKQPITWLMEQWSDAIKSGSPVAMQDTYSFDILREATEYYVLHRLSLHLSSYFGELERKDAISEKQLQVLHRDDLMHVLPRNRFLDLFTKPMSERAAFIEDERADGMRNAIYANSSKGALYNRIEVKLPKGSHISKSHKKTLVITTKRLELEIKTNFQGMGAISPRNFEEYYLGLNYPDVRNYEVPVTIIARFRLGALLTVSGWNYYQWLDSFLEDLSDKLESAKFYENIGWEQTMTFIEVLSNNGGIKKGLQVRRIRAKALNKRSASSNSLNPSKPPSSS